MLVGVGVLAGCGTSTPKQPSSPRAHGAVAPQGRSVVQGWMANAAPAGWDARSGRIVVNRRGRDGLWDVYSVAPGGRHPSCISCRRPSFPGAGADTQRGATDVVARPDGSYVLETVERAPHPGPIGWLATDPGKGLYNDVWIEKLDGSAAWRLTDPSSMGAIWPRFDRSGNRIVWAEMREGADLSHPLGQWRMKLATVDWSTGAPRLRDVRTFDPQPGRFYEPYGFSPDGDRILFASDLHVRGSTLAPSATNAQIWTVSSSLEPATVQRVSPGTTGGAFSNYNEFAAWVPGTDRILIARTHDAGAHGMDYWTVGPDGSKPERVTFLNERGTAQYRGYTVAGGFAFDPRDRRRFVAGLSHDLMGRKLEAVFVTIGARGLGR